MKQVIYVAEYYDGPSAHKTTAGYFTDVETAKEAVKGVGWYDTDGDVYAVEVTDYPTTLANITKVD